MEQKSPVMGLRAEPEWEMDKAVASVYLGDIARLQAQIRAKKGMSHLYFGQRFSKRAGFYHFSIFDAR